MNTVLTEVPAKSPVVLVLGGYGFIGRYTLAALNQRGLTTVIGTRSPKDHTTITGQLPDREVRLHQKVQESDWVEVLAGIDVVINAVGILRERGKKETFDAVHHQAIRALSRSCAALKISLVHVSALGIDAAVNNEFSLSKRRGEKAMLDSGCNGVIVRASVVDAHDGYGSGWFHRIAQWPVLLLPANATCSISPVAASDLGEALATLADQSITHTSLGKIHRCQNLESAALLEVSCGEIFDLESYLHRLRRPVTRPDRPWTVVRVPAWLARAFARLFDVLHMTPYSIGHHELLEHDNVPGTNALPAILGRDPLPIRPTDSISINKPLNPPGTRKLTFGMLRSNRASS